MNTTSAGLNNKKKCPHCAEEINIEAKKCKHCGEFLDKSMQPTHAQAIEGTPVRKMSYWKGLAQCIAGGLGMMVISMVILFPLFFMGLIAVVASPIMAFFMLEGDCPYCGNNIVIIPPKKAVKCRSCKQRSSLRDMRLIPLKTFAPIR